LLKSGGDAGENLIAETLACPLAKRVTYQWKGRTIDGEYCPYPENLSYPLDKIFGSIPAGSFGFTQVCPRSGLMCQIAAAYRKHPQIELHQELVLMQDPIQV